MCQKHRAKAKKLTAKALPCVTHGKAHTVYNCRQRGRLPCAFCRAHGKEFAVCLSDPRQNKNTRNKKSYRPAATALLWPPPPAPAVAAPLDFRRCAPGPRPSHPWPSPRCQLRPSPAATTAAGPSPLRRWRDRSSLRISAHQGGSSWPRRGGSLRLHQGGSSRPCHRRELEADAPPPG